MKLGMVALFLRDMSRFEKYQCGLKDIANKHNLKVARIMSNIYGAMMLVVDGHLIGADQFEDASDQYEQKIMLFESAARWAIQADLLLRANSFDRAKVAYDRAKNLAEKTQEFMTIAEIHRIGAIIDFHMKNYEAAEIKLLDGLKIAQKQKALLWELRIASSLSKVWLQKKEKNKAADCLQQVINKFSSNNKCADLYEANALMQALN